MAEDARRAALVTIKNASYLYSLTLLKMVKLHIKITATSNAMNIQSCNWLALPDAFSASRSWSLNIVIIVIFKLIYNHLIKQLNL